MPKDGYTKMFEKMLSNSNIEVVLNTDYKKIVNDIKFDKMIYTGPIDYFFDCMHGKLPYRSIRFEWETHAIEKCQEEAVINYVDREELNTRVTEYKYITGQLNKATTISREYSISEGEPYYPIPSDSNRKVYQLYEAEAKKIKNIIFLGRLAEYQYYNMDQVVIRCLMKFSDLMGNNNELQK